MIDLRHAGQCLFLLIAIAFGSHAARAEVIGIDIASRADVLAGKSFGDAGTYEKIIGKVHFAVDPASAANQRIVDIDKAPRDTAGRARSVSPMAIRWYALAARASSSSKKGLPPDSRAIPSAV